MTNPYFCCRQRRIWASTKRLQPQLRLTSQSFYCLSQISKMVSQNMDLYPFNKKWLLSASAFASPPTLNLFLYKKMYAFFHFIGFGQFFMGFFIQIVCTIMVIPFPNFNKNELQFHEFYHQKLIRKSCFPNGDYFFSC